MKGSRRLAAVATLAVLLPVGCGIMSEPDLFSRTDAGGVHYDVPPEAVRSLRLPSRIDPPGDLIGITDYPDEKFFEIAMGPVELPAGSSHRNLSPALTALPFDVWIHGFDWTMTDGEGSPLPKAMLHHVNLIQPNRREVFAPISRRLFAAGRETDGISLPSLVGMPIRAGSPIILVAMFANPTGKEYPEVVLRLRFPYSREGEGLIGPLEVIPFYLDVAGAAGSKDFPVPPGETVRGWETEPAADGRILAIGGHLHDFGEYLLLRDDTEEETLWRAEPVENEEGRLVSIPSELFILPWRAQIESGHRYRVEAAYRNPTAEPAPDKGMGAIGGIFIPSGPEGWDEPDFDDPVYIEDIAYTLRPRESSGSGPAHGGMMQDAK